MAVGLSGYRAFYMTIRVRDEASRGAQNIGRAIGAMGDEAEIARQRMMGVGRGLMSFGTGMVAAGATGLGVMAGMTREALAFGQQTAYAFTQVDELGTSIDQVRDIAKNVAEIVPVPLENLSQGLYDIYSSIDLTVADSEAVLEQLAKASIAGMTDVRTAARSTVAVMNAYRLTQEDVGYILDWQFQLVRKGVGTYEDFARTIGLALPSFRAADQDLNTLGGSIAFLTRQGLSASRAATSAARAMELLAQPQAVRNLERLGIEVKNADGTFRQMNDIVTDLAEGPFKDLVGPEFREMFKQIFGTGRIQARRFFDIVLKDSEQYNQRVAEFIEMGGAMENAYDIMYNEPIMRSQELAIQFDLLKVEIGERLIPAFERLVGWVSALLDGWDKLSPAIKTSIVWFVVATSLLLLVGGAALFASGAMVLFYAAFLPILAQIGWLTTAITWLGVKFITFTAFFGKIIPAIKGAAIAFGTLFTTMAAGLGISVGALVAIIVAIIAAVVLLIVYWDKVWPAIKKAWFWVAALADVIWDKLVGALYATGRWFTRLWDSIWGGLEAAGRFFKGLGLAIWGGLRTAGSAVKSAFWSVINAFQTAWFAVAKATDIAWEGIKTGLSAAWREVSKAAISFGSLIVNDVFIPVWDFITRYTSIVWRNIMILLDYLWREIINNISTAWQWIKNNTVNVWNFIEEKLADTWGAIKGLADEVWGIIQNQLVGKWNLIKESADEIWGKLSPALSAIWTELGDKLGPAWDLIREHGNTAWDLFVDEFNESMNRLEPIWSAVWTAMKWSGTNIWDAMKWLFWAFINGLIWLFQNPLHVAWDATWKAMSIAAQAVWAALKVAWAATIDFILKLPGRTWTGLKAAWEGIKIAWFATWDAMKWTWQNAIWPAMKWVGTTSWMLMKGAWEGIKVAWEVTWEALKVAWSATLDFIVKLPGRILTGLEAAWDGVKTAWDATWQAIQTSASAFWSWMQTAWIAFVSAWPVMWNGIKVAAVAVWDALKWAWSGLWSGMVFVAQGAWPGIKWVFDKIQEFVDLVWPTITSALSTAWNATWNAMEIAATESWEGIKFVFGKIKEFALFVWPGITNFFSAAWRGMWSGMKWLGINAWEGMKVFFGGIKTFGETVWTGITRVFTFAWDTAWAAITVALDVALSLMVAALALFTGDWETAKNEILGIATMLKDGIFNFFANAGTWLYQTGKDLLTGLWDGFKSEWDGFWSWLTDKWNSMKGLFSWNPFSLLSGSGTGTGSGAAYISALDNQLSYRDIAAGGGTHGLTQLAQNLGTNTQAINNLTQMIELAETLGTPLGEGAITRDEVIGWVDAINNAVDPFAMSETITSNISKWRIGDNTSFQRGGIVTSPGLYGLGEGGSEAIIPLSRPGDAAAVMDAAGIGSQGITVNVYGRPEEDDITFARRVALAVGEEVFANGY